MRKTLSFLLVGLFFITTAAFSQSEVKGRVVDKETQEPLIGVTIYSTVSKKSAATDLNGEFKLTLPSLAEEIEFTYIGFKNIRLKAANDLGIIQLESSFVGLEDVVVTSSLAIRRKTPVALSVIDPVVAVVTHTIGYGAAFLLVGCPGYNINQSSYRRSRYFSSP